MTTSARRRTGASCIALILGAVLLSGCDTVESDSIIFQKEVDFRFEFSTAGADAGEAIQVNEQTAVDFSDLLAPEGFSRDDVIGVNVRSVSVERISPVGATLDVFDQVEFTLRATGLNVPTIARAEGLPNGREVDLNVIAPGITQAVIQPEFGARLTVVPASAHAEEYVLAATMDVSVEVEGI
jgi:hypothetical protein